MYLLQPQCREKSSSWFLKSVLLLHLDSRTLHVLLVKLERTSCRISFRYLSTWDTSTHPRIITSLRVLLIHIKVYLHMQCSVDYCMFLFCATTKSYQGLISDQRVPDAGHGLADAQVGVKLVAIQTRHELGQERSQLLPGLGSNHVKAKSCSL